MLKTGKIRRHLGKNFARSNQPEPVMAGLDPAIQSPLADPRVKPGDDDIREEEARLSGQQVPLVGRLDAAAFDREAFGAPSAAYRRSNWRHR